MADTCKQTCPYRITIADLRQYPEFGGGGVPRIRLHDLRHTAASLRAANGVPIVTAAALLGHDPMVFAKVYAHQYADDLGQASEVLSGLYSEAQ